MSIHPRGVQRWLDRLPPSDVNRYELLRGQIVMCPPAVWLHGSVEANLIRHLGEHVIANDLAVVFGSSTGIDLPSADTVHRTVRSSVTIDCPISRASPPRSSSRWSPS